MIALTVGNGLWGVVVSRFDKPVWQHHRLVSGLALSAGGTAVFILTRQPYAGIVFLTILVIKGALLAKRRRVP